MAGVPHEPGSLIGRDSELAQLQTLHAGARLLTMLGPPGMGKSRLGMRLAATLSSDYSDGIWFVDVGAIPDARILPHVLLRVLDIRQEPGQSPLGAVSAHLRDRQALLILDACEYALEACTTLARALCDRCPRLHVLAISREPMHTSGDTIWRTPPLSVPEPAVGRAEVAAADSVQLIVARARRHDARFSVTRANCAQVGELCRYLGGVPLALELVAPHISSRSIPRLPFVELREHSDGAHVIRTTLCWANDRLPKAARLLLRRLSVFGGSFDAAAVTTVCADRALQARNIEPALEHLLGAALLRREPEAGEERYRLLDSVREFAFEQLCNAHEEEIFNERLRDFMLLLVERVPPEAVSPQQAAVLEREIDNIRAALTWALRRGAAELAVRLAVGACSLWYFRGYYSEGCEWLERGLDIAPQATSSNRARAAAWLGQLLQFRGEYAAAERWLTLAVELHQRNSDKLGFAFASAMLGQLVLALGELERAAALCAEAAERLEGLGQPMHVASRLQVATASIELGDLSGARAILQQCADQGLESHSVLGTWLQLLEGRLSAAAGDLVLARQQLAQAVQLGLASREQPAIAVAFIELGYVDLEQHSPRRAETAFLEAVEVARRSNQRMQLARAVEGLAGSVAETRPAFAVRLISAANRLRTLLGGTAWPHDWRRIASWLAAAQRSLPQRDYAVAWKLGQTTSLDETLGLMRVLASPPTRPTPTFTARERQIISMLAGAATNEQIARKLAIRPATARTHVEHVMSKLGLHKRAEVVLWASRNASNEINQATA